jgi:hypothetical protein
MIAEQPNTAIWTKSSFSRRRSGLDSAGANGSSSSSLSRNLPGCLDAGAFPCVLLVLLALEWPCA